MRIDLVLIDSETLTEIVTLENIPLLISELEKPIRLGAVQGLPETVYHIKKVLEFDFTTDMVMRVKALVVAI